MPHSIINKYRPIVSSFYDELGLRRVRYNRPVKYFASSHTSQSAMQHVENPHCALKCPRLKSHTHSPPTHILQCLRAKLHQGAFALCVLVGLRNFTGHQRPPASKPRRGPIGVPNCDGSPYRESMFELELEESDGVESVCGVRDDARLLNETYWHQDRAI